MHYEEGAAVLTCAHCGTEYALDLPTEGFIEFTFEEAEEEAIPDVAAVTAEAAPAYEAEALALLRSGQKIAAIKYVRAYTGLGLREAKQVVEKLAVREGIVLPAGGNKACVVVVAGIIFLAAVGAAAFVFLAR
ncbi:MAG: ribosomal protein L7/L12 [Candidatus Coatesbacteria bacterium]|nr:MAG: ribosomal protein L7/L12 [Candidatus Coatesbacteria bacterium]